VINEDVVGLFDSIALQKMHKTMAHSLSMRQTRTERFA